MSPKIAIRVALLPAAALVACAPLAQADMYTWTDERGATVISDTPPSNPKRVDDLQVVVREPAGSGRRSGPREPTPTEQKLLGRIDDLENRLAARTYGAPPSAPPAAAPAVSYYTSPAPSYGYDPYYYDYSAAYYPPYYPSYYVPSYSYSYVVPGAVIVNRGFRGRAFAASRSFPHRGGFTHRGRR